MIAGPVPVTQDGPSHVYNAATAVAAREGVSPQAALFVARDDIRPNLASFAGLSLLGPRVGWPGAERIIIVLCLLATLASALLLVSARAMPLIVLSGWLASSWFVWMGFYDFALSIPGFLALVWLLTLASTPRRRLALQGVLALLYFTHLFTFAIGVAFVTVTSALRSMADEKRDWRQLLAAVPGVLALLLEVAVGGDGGSTTPAWSTGPLTRMRDFVTADFFVTVLWLDSVVGIVFMLALATVVWPVISARRDGSASITASPLVLLGASMIIGSLFAPDAIGEGGYVPARMRLLGIAALLPALSARCARTSSRAQLAAAGLLLSVLAARSLLLRQESQAMSEVTGEVEALLDRVPVRRGEWMVTRLSTYRRWPVRVGVYRHLGERAAVSRGLVVLNNYEALYGIFSVSWRERPDWIVFRPVDATLAATFVPGDIDWSGPIHVLHERNRRIVPADSLLQVVSSHPGARFAVTTLRQRR